MLILILDESQLVTRLSRMFLLISSLLVIIPFTYQSTVRDPLRLWPNGQVPYHINSSNIELHNVVEQAIQAFHNSTCVRFVPRTNQRDYINIIDDEVGCHSFLGRKLGGGEQILLLGKGCKKVGIAIHELMHAIGFFAEHQRTDRDEHIVIIEDNITPNSLSQYNKATTDQMLLIGNYDMDSIMHHPSGSFARRPELPTMRAKNSDRTNFGGEVLTTEDIRKIKIIYSCE